MLEWAGLWLGRSRLVCWHLSSSLEEFSSNSRRSLIILTNCSLAVNAYLLYAKVFKVKSKTGSCRYSAVYAPEPISQASCLFPSPGWACAQANVDRVFTFLQWRIKKLTQESENVKADALSHYYQVPRKFESLGPILTFGVVSHQKCII